MPLALTFALFLAAADQPKLVVLDFEGAGLDPAAAAALTEATTHQVERTGFFSVVSSGELQALLGLERQKALLGCNESSACMTELSGALGARFVMRGTVSKLGDALQLTLTTLDTQKGQTLGRSSRVGSSLEAMRAVLPWAVAEATGTPPPAPPSQALPVGLLVGGGLATVFGLAWGAVHLSQELQLNAVLQSTAGTPGILGTRASYLAELTRLETQRWIAVGALGVGVAVMVVGGVLFSNNDAPRVALVPTHHGAALVGVW